jgi:hypothetical protein
MVASRAAPPRVRRFVVGILFALSACDAPQTTTPPTKESATKAATRALEWVKPGSGNPVAFALSEVERAKADGRTLLFYVGGESCEPCKRFHDASARGELNNEFGHLRLIDFDIERDAQAIEALGCVSRMIPLFAVPTAEGKCDPNRQIQGAIKGEGAVGFISPKLKALVSGT